MKHLLSNMASTPFALPACVLALGIVCGRYCVSSLPFYIASFGLIAGIIILLLPYFVRSADKRMKLKLKWRNAIWVEVLSLFFFAGLLMINLSSPQAGLIERYPYARGVVEDVKNTTTSDIVTVKANALISDSGKTYSVPDFKILVYTQGVMLHPADVIVFKNNANTVNENTSSYNYLYSKGIYYISNTTSDNIKLVDTDSSLRYKARDIRDDIGIFIDRSSLQTDTKGFIEALLLGDKGGINEEDQKNFAASGIAHILSLSGLHVGVILLILGSLLMPLNLWGLKDLRFILMGIGVISFVYITGMNLPAMRAAVMALCLLSALLLQRPNSSINALSMAICIILLVSPRALFDVGFQLSVMSTLAIIGVIKLINDNVKYGLRNKLLTAIAVPLSAVLITWPIAVYYFHSMPAMFLPLNLLAVPLLPIYMVTVLFYFVLFALGLDVAPLAYLVDSGYSLLSAGANEVNELHLHSEGIFLHPIIYIVGIIASIILLYAIRSGTKTSQLSALIGYAALFFIIILLPSQKPDDKLTIPSDYQIFQVKSSLNGKEQSVLLQDGVNTTYKLPTYAIHFVDAAADSLANHRDKYNLLVVGRNFKGDIEKLLNELKPNTVMFSARLFPNIKEEFIEQCKRKNIPTHSLSDSDVEINLQ